MHHHMKKPPNYPLISSPGQFGTIGMSGMFTVLKVREGLSSYAGPGWYQNTPGTVSEAVSR